MRRVGVWGSGGVEPRSNRLWLALLGLWGASTVALVSRFLPLADPGPRLPLVLLVLVALSYFLLVGFFNVGVNVVSHTLKDSTPRRPSGDSPRVALFCCTVDDFDPLASETLLRLTYPLAEFWLLDDSKRDVVQRRVDQFARIAASSGRVVRTVRRTERTGFKAGAINNALRLLPKEVQYIGIIDADERLPPSFVEDCLSYFTQPDVAFVQASHRSVNAGSGWFTRYLGVGVDLHWKHYQPYRNRFGTVNMLGHGALLRRDVLEELGGFPELTCEDLAYTAVSKMAGYRGVFAKDVVCGETFPEDFDRMRQRHRRWCAGTVEFLRGYAVPLVRSRVRWHEKLDLLLPSMNLPSVLLLLAFVLATQALWALGEGPRVFRDPLALALGSLAAFAPLIAFVDLIRRPLFALKTIAVNTMAYVALFPSSVVGVLRGLIRPAEFIVTPKGLWGARGPKNLLADTRVELSFGIGLLALGHVTAGPVGLASPLGVMALFAPVLMAASRPKANGKADIEELGPVR